MQQKQLNLSNTIHFMKFVFKNLKISDKLNSSGFDGQSEKIFVYIYIILSGGDLNRLKITTWHLSSQLISVLLPTYLLNIFFPSVYSLFQFAKIGYVVVLIILKHYVLSYVNKSTYATHGPEWCQKGFFLFEDLIHLWRYCIIELVFVVSCNIFLGLRRLMTDDKTIFSKEWIICSFICWINNLFLTKLTILNCYGSTYCYIYICIFKSGIINSFVGNSIKILIPL